MDLTIETALLCMEKLEPIICDDGYTNNCENVPSPDIDMILKKLLSEREIIAKNVPTSKYLKMVTVNGSTRKMYDALIRKSQWSSNHRLTKGGAKFLEILSKLFAFAPPGFCIMDGESPGYGAMAAALLFGWIEDPKQWPCFVISLILSSGEINLADNKLNIPYLTPEVTGDPNFQGNVLRDSDTRTIQAFTRMPVSFYSFDGGIADEAFTQAGMNLRASLFAAACNRASVLVATGGHAMIRMLVEANINQLLDSLIYLAHFFGNICFWKPPSSSPLNAEVYIIALNKKLSNEVITKIYEGMRCSLLLQLRAHRAINAKKHDNAAKITLMEQYRNMFISASYDYFG